MFYVIIIFFLKTNCSKFYDGIGGVKLRNDKKLNFCFFKKPKICGIDLLSGLFDISYFRRKGCSGINDNKKIFLKYLNSDYNNFNNFSYPRTEFFDPNISYNDLANLIEKKINIANSSNSKKQ